MIGLALCGGGCASAAADESRDPPPAGEAAQGPQPDRHWQLDALALAMKWIPPGNFLLGSTREERDWAANPEGGKGEAEWFADEPHPIEARVDRGFWMGQTAVTRGMFRCFAELEGYLTEAERAETNRVFNSHTDRWEDAAGVSWRDPGYEQDDDHPAVFVSWNDAMAFCDWLNRAEGGHGRVPEGYEYRLPGEVEWEYAALGGREERTPFWWGTDPADGAGRLNGSGLDRLPDGSRWSLRLDWEDGFVHTSPVDFYGERGRNGFGLADMAGNVWEWCYDGYDRSGPQQAISEGEGSIRMMRGASYMSAAGSLRIANRGRGQKDGPRPHRGFRIVLAPKVDRPAALAPPSPTPVATIDSTRPPFPQRPIRVVVPFAPGGSSDTLARAIQQAVPRERATFAILNVPGAGGSIGSYRVKNARPDGYTLLFLHDGIVTAKYSGQSDYGPEAFFPVAATGAVGLVVCAGGEAPFAGLEDLLEAARERPGTVTFGGDPRAPSHYVGLRLETSREGAAFRFVSAGGGAERFAALAGGHLDATIFSVSEFLQFRTAGVQALAYLGEARHPELPDLATAREQGVDVVADTTQFWWAPRGTPPERVAFLADLLEEALLDPDLQDFLRRSSVGPLFLRDGALEARLAEIETRVAATAVAGEARALPVAGALLALTLVFAGLSVVSARRRRGDSSSGPEASGASNDPIDLVDANEANEANHLPAPEWLRAAALALFLVLYVLLLHLRLLPYWLSTWIFVAAAGCLLAPRLRGRLAAAGFGLALGLGLQWLFERVFYIDLPGA